MSRYLTAEHRVSALRQLREQISVQCSRLNHADLESPRIRKDESDVTALVDLIGRNWTNPFASEQSDLGQLSTVVAATPEISSDLLQQRKRGKKHTKLFRRNV